jgi:DNA (cytosine-5)-methyltransferase 1
MKANPHSLIGLFAGIGGIEKGFISAGFEVLSANEIDTAASRTYKANFSHPIVVDDIKNVTSGDLLEGQSHVTVLSGGFPCQPFSVAGYRKGFEDERGNVFWEIHRLIMELQPEVIFLENVKNLETHDNGRTFSTIKAALRGEISSPSGSRIEEGYTVKSAVLNARDFGIPQNRERIYIVAFKDSEVARQFEFPEGRGANRSLPPLQDFIDFDSKVNQRYYYDENRPFYDELEKHITDENTVYQWRRQYVRANKSGVCPTLTANMGMGGHNVPLIKTKFGIRKLTPKECFALMGFGDVEFPEGASDSQLYKQAGNAVVVPVIRSIADNILKSLG